MLPDPKMPQEIPVTKGPTHMIKEFLFNIWCFFCLYVLGAFYVLVELNRKWKLFGDVRSLDLNKDVPSDLSNEVCIITGGSRGIGWETAKVLVTKGCHVIVATSVKSGQPIAKLTGKLKSELKVNPDKLELWHLDLSSMKSITDFVTKFTSSGLGLNVLINNAGVMYIPFKLTEDGFESHLAINYLGHCLLIWALMPILNATAKKSGKFARIVNVASSTHFARNMQLTDLNGLKYYSPFHAYAQSKLAQIMFTYRMHEYLKSSEKFKWITINSLHPGVVKTELYEHVLWVKMLPFIATLLFRVCLTSMFDSID